jgi:hypothetical protein
MGCVVEVQGPTSIAGGFVLVSVAGLMAARAEGRGRLLTRAYLALLEIRARRCRIGESQVAACSHAELAGLLGVTAKKARALARRLEAAGLVTWESGLPVFPEPKPADVEALRDTIGGGLGSVIIPRRMLRFLAGGARPALIATVLGIILRCLSRRKGGFDGRGRVKAAWIARVFGVALSRVKAARKELIALGWITPEPGDQWAMNRWGRAYRVSLDWAALAGSPVGPPPTDPGPPVGLPDLDQDLPYGNDNNQEPASGGPAGVQVSEREGRTEIPNSPAAIPPVVPPSPAPAPARSQTPGTTPASPVTGSPAFSPSARPAATPGPSPAVLGPVPSPSGLPAPRLEDVRVEDLKDTGRLLDLLGQAVARGLVSTSEADRLRFVGAAEHALGIGKENPAGLFIYLIRGRLWRYLTQDDEDGANLRIKAFLRGPERPRLALSTPRPAARPMLSEDARLVIRVRSALASKGFRGDPFPQVRRLDASWTRERWDLALAELEGA